MFKKYYLLTKPGIIRGNAVSAAAGFLLACALLDTYDVRLFVAMLGGLSLIIASACVFNNYIDRDIDHKMARTKNRALVNGTISGAHALIFAVILGVAGAIILGLFTNLLTLAVALFGHFMYVVVYGYFKRRTPLGTVVGSVSGAVPPVVGYCAVTNHLDMAALILFFILVFWQMPHFYAIAMYRLKDYTDADIPVLPATNGIYTTKVNMLVYIIGFIAAVTMLTLFGYTGYVFLVVTVLIGLAWLRMSIQGFKAKDTTKWARQMFFFSLKVMIVLSLLIAVGGLLP